QMAVPIPMTRAESTGGGRSGSARSGLAMPLVSREGSMSGYLRRDASMFVKWWFGGGGGFIVTKQFRGQPELRAQLAQYSDEVVAAALPHRVNSWGSSSARPTGG